MVIKSASFSQNPKNPDNLNFNLVLQQIKTVQIEKSKIDIPKKTEGNVVDPSGSSAAKKVSKGANTPLETSLDSWTNFTRLLEKAPTAPLP